MREESFYLPAFGHLRAKLFDESEAVAGALDKRGELERLKHLPQLGIVQRQWRSANHSRWAYMVLMLSLISRSFEVADIRLGSRVRLPGGRTFSSARELLRCWVLLSNTGHLWWTFTSERMLLEELNSGRPECVVARDSLLRSVQGFGAAPSRWAKEVLDGNRYYQLYQLISLFRLRRVLRGYGRENIDLQRSALLALYVDDYATSLQVRRARVVFRRLRRLAFLALDAEYTPSALHISLSRVLNDLETLTRLLVPQGDEPDELSGLDQFLTSGIYLGEPVLRIVAASQRGLRDRVRAALGEGLAYTISEMVNVAWFTSIEEDRVEQVLRLRWDEADSLAPDLRDPVQVAGYLQGEAAPLRLALHTVCETDPGQNVVILQTHAAQGSMRGRAAGIYLGVRWFQRALSGAQELAPRIADIPPAFVNNLRNGRNLGREVLTAALRLFFDDKYVWEWDQESFQWFTLCGNSDELDECFDFVPRISSYSKVRKHEMASLRRSLRHIQSDFYIAGLANVRAYAPDERSPAAELDGTSLTIDASRRVLRLTVIEAKLQRARAESDCRRSLAGKLSVLAPQRGVTRSRMTVRQEGRAAAAWTHLRVPFAR